VCIGSNWKKEEVLSCFKYLLACPSNARSMKKGMLERKLVRMEE
jgi:hypothetical protein